MAKNLVGEKFGRLTVIKEIGRLRGYKYWLCKCSCGNKTKLNTNALTTGNTISCGCFHNESVPRKHMMTGTPLYRVWQNMKNRCYNKKQRNYKDYGGRGIIVCDEWKHDFLAFYNWAIKSGYKSNLEIDRYPNKNGNYEPSNCRWATEMEQVMNRRNTLFITIGEDTKTINDWSLESGVNKDVIYYRYYFYKWNGKEAVFTPSRGALRNSKGKKLKQQ